MTAGTILKDIYTSLSAVLAANVEELSVSGAITSFSPALVNPGPSVVLSIYPYQIHKNLYMANEEPIRTGFGTMTPSPLTVDVYFSFTPFSATEYAEITVLEKIMSTFNDHPILDSSNLKGNLIANGNDVLRIVPVNMNTDEINKFWSLFSKPYKLFSTYMITPVRIPSSLSSTFTRVVQVDTEFSSIGE